MSPHLLLPWFRRDAASIVRAVITRLRLFTLTLTSGGDHHHQGDVLGVPVAAGLLYPVFGLLLSPILAGAAMSLSSVSVILNALRLRSIRL